MTRKIDKFYMFDAFSTYGRYQWSGFDLRAFKEFFKAIPPRVKKEPGNEPTVMFVGTEEDSTPMKHVGWKNITSFLHYER